eukprot:scaffold18646_cov90-Isochrysis_galbana.AAC.1
MVIEIWSRGSLRGARHPWPVSEGPFTFGLAVAEQKRASVRSRRCELGLAVGRRGVSGSRRRKSASPGAGAAAAGTSHGSSAVDGGLEWGCSASWCACRGAGLSIRSASGRMRRDTLLYPLIPWQTSIASLFPPSLYLFPRRATYYL